MPNWYNFYQQFDTDSLRTVNWFHVPGGFPTNIRGRTITPANQNGPVTNALPITVNDFQADRLIRGFPPKVMTSQAHVLIPMLNVVRKKITDEIKMLPASKAQP